jgi:hypothetical protein
VGAGAKGELGVDVGFAVGAALGVLGVSLPCCVTIRHPEAVIGAFGSSLALLRLWPFGSTVFWSSLTRADDASVENDASNGAPYFVISARTTRLPALSWT